MSELLVNSSPSKEFFIKMITKDVTVESCILDLIDNSIDSHKKQKGVLESKICINYSIEDDFFEITDDCGGMAKDTAQKVAFKFGNEGVRDSGVLGMYGIGMKRSIFKIGNNFEVFSKTKDDSFKVYMDLEEWLNLNDGENDIWKFYYEDTKNEFDDGVHIHISKLSDSLKEYLSWPVNIDRLKRKIGGAYRDLLSKNITIYINNEAVISVSETLYEATFLKTYVKTITDIPGVQIKIVAGVGDPKPKDAGWNIVSNGRVIIEKNRESLTGWETEYNSEEETDIDEILEKRSIPAYHNDFARFRGYVFIDSDNSAFLPLNTTKDGIDEQHKLYRFIIKEMTDVMRIILPRLRDFVKVSRAYNQTDKVTPESAFVPKNLLDYSSVEKSGFKLETSEFVAVDTMKSISIRIPTKQLEFLKSFFDVSTNKQVAENLLNYVLERIDMQDE